MTGNDASICNGPFTYGTAQLADVAGRKLSRATENTDAIGQRASPSPRVSAVTGKYLKSYYILGSTTKLASWTAPGVSLLVVR